MDQQMMILSQVKLKHDKLTQDSQRQVTFGVERTDPSLGAYILTGNKHKIIHI